MLPMVNVAMLYHGLCFNSPTGLLYHTPLMVVSFFSYIFHDFAICFILNEFPTPIYSNIYVSCSLYIDNGLTTVQSLGHQSIPSITVCDITVPVPCGTVRPLFRYFVSFSLPCQLLRRLGHSSHIFPSYYTSRHSGSSFYPLFFFHPM